MARRMILCLRPERITQLFLSFEQFSFKFRYKLQPFAEFFTGKSLFCSCFCRRTKCKEETILIFCGIAVEKLNNFIPRLV